MMFVHVGNKHLAPIGAQDSVLAETGLLIFVAEHI